MLLVALIFGLIGAYFVFRSMAAAPELASVEAEKMSLNGAVIISDSQASGSQAVKFSTKTSITSQFTITEPAATIVVKAKGEQCQGVPTMTLNIAGTQVPAVSVSSTSWYDYSASVNIPAGSHALSVTFDNPYTSISKNQRKGCIRTLSVDKVTIFGANNDPAPGTELARGKPVTASTTSEVGLEPAKANDGLNNTRWSSKYIDNQWWQVDLGSIATVNKVDVNWEAAYASNYKIQGSTDGNNFTDLANVSVSAAGLKSTTFANTSARYVRILGVTRATPWGISIWEAQVFGTSSTTPPPPPPSSQIYWGAFMDGDDTYDFYYPGQRPGGGYNSTIHWGDAPWDQVTWNKFESNAGKKVSILHYGQPPPWVQTTFYGDVADKITIRGAIPMISMGSADTILLSDIAGGKYDTQIATWATNVKNYGKPLFLRFNWEMNGDWYGYGKQARANPASYVAAWRQFHKIATANGATNINWVWCPNVVFSGSTPLASLYPGDAYVDWTAMDGYNFAGTTMS